MNSLRHGLTSTTLVVLPEENRREYEEILRGFRESLKPAGAFEDALVARLAQTHWRGLRSRRVETGMLDITAASQRDLARQVVGDRAAGPVAQLASLRHRHLTRLLPNARHAHTALARAPDETRRPAVHHGRCRSNGKCPIPGFGSFRRITIYHAMGGEPAMFTVLFAIPAPSAGWRSGRNCCRIPSRRSLVRGRYIPATTSASSFRWKKRGKLALAAT